MASSNLFPIHKNLLSSFWKSLESTSQGRMLNRETFLSTATDEVIWFLTIPYIAGQGIPSLIQAVKSQHDHGLLSTTDLLGENLTATSGKCVESLEMQALKNEETICDVITALKQDPHLGASVSIKPSALCVVHGEVNEHFFFQSYEAMKRILGFAKERKVNVTIDMEDSRWTQFTIDAYLSYLKQGFTNVGVALQTRLNRSADDLERIIHEAGAQARVRLCIGVYEEKGNPNVLPPDLKYLMKSRMRDYANQLLRQGAFVEFATHDEENIRQFFTEVAFPEQHSPTQFEIQMLKGVPRAKLQRTLVAGAYYQKLFESWSDSAWLSTRQHPYTYLRPPDGVPLTHVPVRIYTPFVLSGEAGQRSAIQYCRRRLSENQDMWNHALKEGLHLYGKALYTFLFNHDAKSAIRS